MATSMRSKVLFCGPVGSVGFASWQRAEILRRLDFNVAEFDETPYMKFDRSTRLRWLVARYSRTEWTFPVANVNAYCAEFLNRIDAVRPDVVWVEEALLLRAETLVEAKRIAPQTTFVSWMDDNPFGLRQFEVPLWRNYIPSIPFYDVHFVKRKSDIDNWERNGARRVVMSHFGFCLFHQPHDPSEVPAQFRHETVFIGTAMDGRHARIAYLLSKQKLPVDVYGGLWNRHLIYHRFRSHFHGAVYGPRHAQIVSGSKICLGYLSSSNLDDYTSRSAEIPACAGFLLAQRTSAHQAMYQEGVEAEFFDSDEECADKIRFYLKHEDLRRRIALAGYARCTKEDYSLSRYIREAMQEVLRLRSTEVACF